MSKCLSNKIDFPLFLPLANIPHIVIHFKVNPLYKGHIELI